jgi:hypothetical protein
MAFVFLWYIRLSDLVARGFLLLPGRRIEVSTKSEPRTRNPAEVPSLPRSAIYTALADSAGFVHRPHIIVRIQ